MISHIKSTSIELDEEKINSKIIVVKDLLYILFIIFLTK